MKHGCCKGQLKKKGKNIITNTVFFKLKCLTFGSFEWISAKRVANDE